MTTNERLTRAESMARINQLRAEFDFQLQTLDSLRTQVNRIKKRAGLLLKLIEQEKQSMESRPTKLP